MDGVDEAFARRDGEVVDSHDAVAGTDTGNRRRRTRQDFTDNRLVRFVAGYSKGKRADQKNQVAKQKVRKRSGQHDREPAPGRFRLEVALADSLPGKEIALLLRLRNPVVFAFHRAEAADRQRAQRILRSATGTRPGKELWAEAD